MRAQFAATNSRGGRVAFGTGDGAGLHADRLFLAAIGGCTAIDVDILTPRRANPILLRRGRRSKIHDDEATG